MKNAQILTWNVYEFNYSTRELKVFNVFEHNSFYCNIRKLLKKDITKDAFAEQLRREAQYYYWSKTEWESVITDSQPCIDKRELQRIISECYLQRSKDDPPLRCSIEELYRREKYDIMGAVTAKALALGINERTDDGRTWIEMELVRQTIIAMLKLNKNGDCISDNELGDAVAVFDAYKIIEKTYYADRNLGVMALTVVKYAMRSDESEAAILIDSVRPFVPQIDTVSLELIREVISKRSLTAGNREKWIYKDWNELLKVIDSTLAGR